MDVSWEARQRQELLIVSNRLPVTMKRTGSGYKYKSSGGGLATALSGIGDAPFLWLGWPGTHVAVEDRPEVTRVLRENHRSIPVFLTRTQIEKFYNRFSNGVLWPLFHYLPESSDFDLASWNHYQEVNRRFAEQIVPLLRPDTIVWIHDYQLMLLPKLLRQQVPEAKIGFFLHIPFPSTEVYRLLPVRSEILEGMLGADVIGFHTHDYARHFRNSCMRILGCAATPSNIEWESQRVRLSVNPIGIDVDHFRQLAEEPATVRELAKLRRKFEGRKVILGVDRMDYSKGLDYKLHAFERLLDEHPAWRTRLVLLQVAVPSRTGVGRYQQLRRDIEERVGHINGVHASVEHTPVQFLFKSVSPTTLSALYQLADVCWVSSVRDGMNLVSHEYVASQKADNVGALVLSEFTGAANILDGALLVNPWNVDEMADTVRGALEMPEDQRVRRQQQMAQAVTSNTASAWAGSFVESVRRYARRKATPARRRSLLENLDPLLEACEQGRRRFFLLDYDGTLRRFTATPQEAEPPPRLLTLLGALARDPRNELYVVSGRPAATLQGWLGALPIGLCAEHGHLLRPPGEETWQTLIPADVDWKATVLPILESFAAITSGALVECKAIALAWHWRRCDPEFGQRQANELAWHLGEVLANSPVEVLHGHKVVEVRAQGVSKAALVDHLAPRFSPQDFVFAVGDDRTDEDLFGQLPAGAWSCHVGTGPTQALSFVEKQSDVLRVLMRLAQHLRRAAVVEH